MRQLDLQYVFDFELIKREKAILAYAFENRDLYRAQAKVITPDLSSWQQIWDRFAFAILSANTPFKDTVDALKVVTLNKGATTPADIVDFKMVPAKAGYLNDLPRDLEAFKPLLKGKETWSEYRLRLQANVRGLGLCKASFTVCLLYPLRAQVACLDTHMQRLYLNGQVFKQLPVKLYQSIEERINLLARKVKVNVFLMQWMIWDFQRGSPNNHNIFPGAHKT